VARAEIRHDRLTRARRPAIPVDGTVAVPTGAPARPLYHGIEQRDGVAVSVESGAVLAVAPDQWADGCAVLEEARTSATGASWTRRTYLDPRSGRALFVEAVPQGVGRSFSTSPERWTGGPAQPGGI